MKKILITGARSYIGMSVEKWLNQPQFSGQYQLDTIDMRDDGWDTKNFFGYDTVLHVAGIVHCKEEKNIKPLYDEVNHLLAVKVLKRAIDSQVSQFIFMSTAAVFDQNDKNNHNVLITREKKCLPKTEYGKSKRNAERDMCKILSLKKEVIKLAIIRPPMVYGKGAKGNYQMLTKVAKLTPVFPYIENQRSMIFIDHLCECIRMIIDKQDSGIFHPQNREYVNTSEMVKEIASLYGKKILLTKKFNGIIDVLSKKINIFNKIFGNFTYQKNISDFYNWDYCMRDWKETIALTETIGDKNAQK